MLQPRSLSACSSVTPKPAQLTDEPSPPTPEPEPAKRSASTSLPLAPATDASAPAMPSPPRLMLRASSPAMPGGASRSSSTGVPALSQLT